MSKPVILFRAFNAFLSQTVSVWSVGMLVAPWILSLVIAGFFASALIVPLSIVCGIIGLIALIWAGCIGYWRYRYLTNEAIKFINRYDFKVLDEFPPETDIPLNTVIVVRQNEKKSVACFKRYIKGQFVVVSVDLDDLTDEEKNVISLPETEMTPIKAKHNLPLKQKAKPVDKLAKIPVQHLYTFVPPSTANNYGQKLKENEICLFKGQDGLLRYSVITPRGITVVDQVIPVEKIKNSQRKKFNKLLKNPDLTLSVLKTFQDDIFKVTLKNGHTTRHPAINQIIQRALAARAPRRMVSAHKSDDQFNRVQQRIITWEKVNTFFSDAPNAFAFSGIIIFIISHVFFGALIPATLLIALLISVAYGGLSAFVRDAQTDSKLKAMQEIEHRYSFLTQKMSAVIGKAQTCIVSAERLLNQCGPSHQEYSSIKNTKQNLEQQIIELKPLQSELITTYNSAHLEFTDKERFRVIYALFYGQIVPGAFLYLALPLVIGALGFPPLSLPILLGIIAPIALIYGIYSMYHKMKVIEQEKWIVMDDEKIGEINNKLDTIDSQQLNASFAKMKELEQQFAQEEKLLLPEGIDEPAPPPTPIQRVQPYFQQFGQSAQMMLEDAATQLHSFKQEVVKQTQEAVTQLDQQYKVLFPPPRVETELKNLTSGTPTLTLGTD